MESYIHVGLGYTTRMAPFGPLGYFSITYNFFKNTPKDQNGPFIFLSHIIFSGGLLQNKAYFPAKNPFPLRPPLSDPLMESYIHVGLGYTTRMAPFGPLGYFSITYNFFWRPITK